jgi:hypothetical protein
MRPQFSFFGSCARPEFWPAVLDALRQNRATFECVFFGPKAPDFEAPELRWFESDASPIECWERASLCSRGELLSLIVDDYQYSPGCLDEAWERWDSAGRDPKLIVSPRYVLHGVDRTQHQMRFVPGDFSSPVMPLGGFFEREFYHSLGGADRRFLGVAADVDIAMRAVIEHGAWVEFLEKGTVVERRDWQPADYVSLSDRHEQTDHVLLRSIWAREGNTWRRTSAPETIF